MSLVGSQFGNVPGMGTVVESFEAAYTWGPFPPRYWLGAYIASTAQDAGNSPTSTLRMGLVMGKIFATGQWTNYSATATDGSQIAAGVLSQNLRLQDVLTETNTAKFYAIMASGGVKAANLLGLDNLARAQLSESFIFDDLLSTGAKFPWLFQQNKTANYSVVVPQDNLCLFTTLGAAGEVDFTLPPIANGLAFWFNNEADQIMKVISNEGSNIVAANNLTASSLAFSTGSQKIGGGLFITSNAAGTKWIAQNLSAGENTITVA